MSKNFSLKELLASDTAKEKEIDNTPSFDVVFHLDELCNTILQPLRESWGSPIVVTSGYRSPQLNKAVGGVDNSAHTLGYGVDLQVPDMSKFDSFVKFVTNWIKDKPFDQCIIEKSKKTRWLHIGFKNAEGKQRQQIKTLIV